MSKSDSTNRRVVFLNYRSTISPERVGGLDTVARAIADLAMAADLDVAYVSYGWPPEKQECTGNDLRFESLADALYYIAAEADVVISFYLDPASRLRFAGFRRRHRQRIRFAAYLSVWNPSTPRRLMALAELLSPFNGGVYCASDRLTRLARRVDSNAALLLPLTRTSSGTPSRQADPERVLRLTFAGRFDRRKGLFDAIEIMQRILQLIPCQCTVSGYFWPDDPDEPEIRAKLAENPSIDVHETKVGGWSEDIERRLEQQLAETDIMLLPYRKLSSTVDTPLLLLEAMAKGCAVYLPARARELLQNLHPNPGFPPPADDATETVATWIASLDENRESLAAVQRANAATHQRLQQETRASIKRILGIA